MNDYLNTGNETDNFPSKQDTLYEQAISTDFAREDLWETDLSAKETMVAGYSEKAESDYKIASDDVASVASDDVASVFDVAAYILKKVGPITTMKLQKLVYYCQAWSLVWDEKQLFKEKIAAWANGPVVRELYSYHRGMYEISAVYIGNPDILTLEQKETIDAVIDYYGNKSSQWLIDLTHIEEPWKKARVGLSISERGNEVISLDSMAEYYSSLPQNF